MGAEGRTRTELMLCMREWQTRQRAREGGGAEAHAMSAAHARACLPFWARGGVAGGGEFEGACEAHGACVAWTSSRGEIAWTRSSEGFEPPASACLSSVCVRCVSVPPSWCPRAPIRTPRSGARLSCCAGVRVWHGCQSREADRTRSRTPVGMCARVVRCNERFGTQCATCQSKRWGVGGGRLRSTLASVGLVWAQRPPVRRSSRRRRGSSSRRDAPPPSTYASAWRERAPGEAHRPTARAFLARL